MMGTHPTQERIKWSEIHIYRLQDGKIAERWAEVSMMELLQQIGALPNPADPQPEFSVQCSEKIGLTWQTFNIPSRLHRNRTQSIR